MCRLPNVPDAQAVVRARTKARGLERFPVILLREEICIKTIGRSRFHGFLPKDLHVIGS